MTTFNCKNPQPDATCGEYVVAYVNNMAWVAQGLLFIINNKILGLTLPLSPIPVNTVDDTTGLCSCTPNLPTEDANVFNCILWSEIKDLLIDSSSTQVGDTAPILAVLCQTIECFLEQTPKVGYGIAAQMERFLCLAESLNSRLDSVSCNNKCPNLIGDLLCLLMQILAKLFAATTKASTLMYYNDCDINPVNGNQIVQSFVECLACDFINDLCGLEQLIAEISALVVGFATCDMQQCTPCYTAPSVPRKVRPICPYNMMTPNTYGSPYGAGYPYQSKSCGCNCNN